MRDKNGNVLSPSENQTSMTVWMLLIFTIVNAHDQLVLVVQVFLVKTPVVYMLVLQQQTTDRCLLIYLLSFLRGLVCEEASKQSDCSRGGKNEYSTSGNKQ